MGVFLLGLGLMIFAGYAGTIVFQRTRLPEAVLLMVIGIVLGPVAHLLDTQLLVRAMPYVGTLALAVILFEGGLGLAAGQVGGQFVRAVVLLALSFGSCVLISLWALRLTGSLDPQTAMLLAVALAATSAPIVMPVISQVMPGGGLNPLLTLESSLSDAVAVVLATTMVHGSEHGILASSLAGNVGRAALLGLVAGVVVGLLWLVAMTWLARGRYPFALTLGCLLVLMGGVETMEGSGAVAILVFGLTLANGGELVRLLPERWRTMVHARLPEQGFKVDHRLHQLLGEVVLLTRTFFFIYLGALMVWPGADAEFWLVLGLLLVALLVSRILSVTMFRLVFHVTPLERRTMVAMAPRGLATAVLAALAAEQGGAQAISPIALALGAILASNLFMAVGIRRMFGVGRKS
jgi:cell volume regulation protein A